MDGGITRIGTMADKETLSASSSSPTNSSTSKTTRKRKFAAKVRTGCDNCKRRRVKCDERKPECLRCLRTGIQCSGYAISEPKVFQPSTVPRSAQTQFSIIDIRPIERDTQFTFSRLINEQGLQLLAKSYYSLHKVRLSSVPYSTAEKQAAFGFYLSCIAPMLAGYGPNGDFWSVLIPQFTFQSPTIRNLVLAAVTIDKKWLLTVRNRQTDHKAQALTYYTTALKAMASGQTNKVEAVVGALMAWTIEAMLFDYTSGAVHLHAARCMLAEVEAESSQTNDHGTYDLASKSLRQALGLAQCYNTIMLSSSAVSRGAHNHSYLATQNGFVSLRTIRSNLSCRLTKAYEDGIGDPARFLRFLNGWENADRANRYHGKESQILKEANHLLFNIACALLPADAAYGISHDTDEKTVHYVLARVHAAIQERFKLVKAEQEILDEILADVLGHLFRLFPQWERWTRHNNLIEELHAQYPAVLRQTGLLDKVKTKGKGMASSVVG